MFAQPGAKWCTYPCPHHQKYKKNRKRVVEFESRLLQHGRGVQEKYPIAVFHGPLNFSHVHVMWSIFTSYRDN
jgi:hypothetical protein